jgi:hypothetical protein
MRTKYLLVGKVENESGISFGGAFEEGQRANALGGRIAWFHLRSSTKLYTKEGLLCLTIANHFANTMIEAGLVDILF